MSSPCPPREPWGKLLHRHTSDPSSSPRLSLVAHCINVASVMQALLALPTLKRRLCVLAGRELTALDMERLCALTFLHDVGKAGSGFYGKGVAPDVLRAWQWANPAGRSQAGHVSVVAPLFLGDPSFTDLADAAGLAEIEAWGQGAVELWLAAISHHGDPVTLTTLANKTPSAWPTWKAGIDGYAPRAGLELLGSAVRALFSNALKTTAC